MINEIVAIDFIFSAYTEGELLFFFRQIANTEILKKRDATNKEKKFLPGPGCGGKQRILWFSEIQDKYSSIWSRSAHFVTSTVPTNFKNASGTFVAMHEFSGISTPNMNAFVKASRG